LEVLRFVRRDSQLSNIPVIVVSAKTMPADIKEGLDFRFVNRMDEVVPLALA